MQTSEIFQDNFCFGEISPLHRHELLENYKVSLSELTNAIVLPSARIRQRPGFIGGQHKDISEQGNIIFMEEIQSLDGESAIFYITCSIDLKKIGKTANLEKFKVSIRKLKDDNKTKIKSVVIPENNSNVLTDDALIDIVEFSNSIYLVQSLNNIFLFSNYFSPKVINIKEEPFKMSNIEGDKRVIWPEYKQYPSKAVIFMDRLWVTSSIAHPTTWWVSGIGYPNNPSGINACFVNDKTNKGLDNNERESPLYSSANEEDIDNISKGFWFRCSAEKPTQVQWVIASRNIFFGDKNNEYSIRPINQYKTLTMNNLKVSVESGIGGSDVKPLLLNKECLFVDRSKHKLFLFATDSTTVGQKPLEISFLSEHLLGGDGTDKDKEIVKLIYQEDPYGIIWVVMSDGTLVSITYHEQQKVLGWGRHYVLFGDSSRNIIKFISGCCADNKDLFVLSANDGVFKLNDFNKTNIELYDEKDALVQKKGDPRYVKKDGITVKEETIINVPVKQRITTIVKIKTNNLFYSTERNVHIKTYEKKSIKLGVYLFSATQITGAILINGKEVEYDFKGIIYKNVEMSASDEYSDNIQIEIEFRGMKPITILGFHAKYAIKVIDKKY